MRISLVAGLPASGKTTHLEKLATQGAATIDDIRSLQELPADPVDWLAIADVNFCRTEVRDAAEEALLRRFPGAAIEWVFFANEPEACLLNAEARSDGRHVAPDIVALSRHYRIPDGCEVIPIPNASNPQP